MVVRHAALSVSAGHTMGDGCSKIPVGEDEREYSPTDDCRRDDDDGVRCFGRVCCQGGDDGGDIDDDDDPLTYDMPASVDPQMEMSVRTVSF